MLAKRYKQATRYSLHFVQLPVVMVQWRNINGTIAVMLLH